MNFIDIQSLPQFVPPKHEEIYIREIRGPATGNQRVSVAYGVLKANGVAEMDTHAESEHVWIILEGELQIDTGKEKRTVSKGMALVVEAGEPHSVYGKGVCDCVYAVVTCPPLSFAR